MTSPEGTPVVSTWAKIVGTLFRMALFLSVQNGNYVFQKTVRGPCVPAVASRTTALQLCTAHAFSPEKGSAGSSEGLLQGLVGEAGRPGCGGLPGTQAAGPRCRFEWKDGTLPG